MKHIVTALFLTATGSGTAYAQDRDAILVSDLCDFYADAIQDGWFRQLKAESHLLHLQQYPQAPDLALKQLQEIISRTSQRLERRQNSHAELGCEYVIA